MAIFRIEFSKVVALSTTIKPYFPLVTTSSFHFREFPKKCAVKPWYYKVYSCFSIFCPSRCFLRFVFYLHFTTNLLLTHSCKIAMVGDFFLKFAHTGPFMWKLKRCFLCNAAISIPFIQFFLWKKMVFCYQNCTVRKNKAENLQNFRDH